MPTVNIRSVPDEVRARFNAGASLRGLTLAKYLERLLELHEGLRRDSLIEGHTEILLYELGLQSVHKEG